MTPTPQLAQVIAIKRIQMIFSRYLEISASLPKNYALQDRRSQRSVRKNPPNKHLGDYYLKLKPPFENFI
ncbi:MAG: hypothetical protein AAF224_08500 [Pseudomonadota bacterium]